MVGCVLRRPEPQQYIGALDRRLRPVDPDRLDRIGTLPTTPSRVRKAHRDPVKREWGFDHIARRPGARRHDLQLAPRTSIDQSPLSSISYPNGLQWDKIVARRVNI